LWQEIVAEDIFVILDPNPSNQIPQTLTKSPKMNFPNKEFCLQFLKKHLTFQFASSASQIYLDVPISKQNHNMIWKLKNPKFPRLVRLAWTKFAIAEGCLSILHSPLFE